MTYEDSRTQQEEERLPLLAWQELSQGETVTSQPMKSLELFVYSSPPNSFLPSLRVLLSIFAEDLYMACHGCRPQTAIICLSQINPFLLEK